jgi:epsilon-lactone hydrolase
VNKLRSATLALALLSGVLAPAFAQSPLEHIQEQANEKPGPRTVPGRAIPVPTATVSPELAAAIARPYRTPTWNANPPDDAAWTKLVNQLAASGPRSSPAGAKSSA